MDTLQRPHRDNDDGDEDDNNRPCSDTNLLDLLKYSITPIFDNLHTHTHTKKITKERRNRAQMIFFFSSCHN